MMATRWSAAAGSSDPHFALRRERGASAPRIAFRLDEGFSPGPSNAPPQRALIESFDQRGLSCPLRCATDEMSLLRLRAGPRGGFAREQRGGRDPAAARVRWMQQAL